ncbi:uncharacterized protein MYCFIDRAFT_192583 [Pseudocercospora fijiensis CIRAD86]|uniref:Uncharacterized protein n=1 Tax=Pseudocercospora fijiensis (strain CIRAD86) TaxID=383855 RepID=N1Q732_PSEFD|nr:uncharacterized protein MYCFIDRAFT_192583 [Pseudocercospora fijiensis CIRAD86]EME88404.1 hypothetical protein MYCFIDRAFT_192583 [Pseudocercospora fijiensis CIRAD86]
MAKEAVRVAELGMSRCATDVGDVEKQLVVDCHTVLREAQAAFDDLEPQDQAEVVWEADDNETIEPPATDNASGGKEVKEVQSDKGEKEVKVKKSRRLHTDENKVISAPSEPPALERKQQRFADPQKETDEPDEPENGGDDAMEM